MEIAEVTPGQHNGLTQTHCLQMAALSLTTAHVWAAAADGALTAEEAATQLSQQAAALCDAQEYEAARQKCEQVCPGAGKWLTEDRITQGHVDVNPVLSHAAATFRKQAVVGM